MRTQLQCRRGVTGSLRRHSCNSKIAIVLMIWLLIYINYKHDFFLKIKFKLCFFFVAKPVYTWATMYQVLLYQYRLWTWGTLSVFRSDLLCIGVCATDHWGPVDWLPQYPPFYPCSNNVHLRRKTLINVEVLEKDSNFRIAIIKPGGLYLWVQGFFCRSLWHFNNLEHVNSSFGLRGACPLWPRLL